MLPWFFFSLIAFCAHDQKTIKKSPSSTSFCLWQAKLTVISADACHWPNTWIHFHVPFVLSGQIFMAKVELSLTQMKTGKCIFQCKTLLFSVSDGVLYYRQPKCWKSDTEFKHSSAQPIAAEGKFTGWWTTPGFSLSLSKMRLKWAISFVLWATQAVNHLLTARRSFGLVVSCCCLCASLSPASSDTVINGCCFLLMVFWKVWGRWESGWQKGCHGDDWCRTECRQR